ncbi:hypothetical protein AB5I41_10145 [Sphingomonas sp. MMS24-JH45]
MLAALAFGLMVAPTLLGNALTVFAPPGAAVQALAGIVNIAASLSLLAGLLAVTAVASDPRSTGARRRRRASATGFSKS